MKSIISILIAFLIFAGSLMPNIDMDELTKVPYLVKHYYEHTGYGAEISFTDFLAMHYDSKSDHAKLPEHQKLPFFNHSLPNLLFVMGKDFSFQPILSETIHYFYPEISTTYIFVRGFSFFQPPRM